MASLLIKARKLSVGDTLILPMGKTAEVVEVRVPTGANAKYVHFKTKEYGSSRVGLDDELYVFAKAVG